MFDAEELYDAIDQCVWALLTRHGIEAPPVDALQLVQEAFRYTVQFEEEEEDGRRPGNDSPQPREPPRQLRAGRHGWRKLAHRQ